MTVSVGVDGGQSQVRLRIAGSSEITTSVGVAHLEGDTVMLLATAVSDAWQRAGSAQPVGRIVLGLTTMPADDATRGELARQIAAATGARDVWLTGDAVTSHAGAFLDQRGVVLAVGTGIACLAVDPRTGRNRRVDGDGFLLGDKGAAFWIGSRGIEAALEAADGRGETTSLSDAAAAAFGDPYEIAARLHARERPIDAIAQFAATVQSHAADGDSIADGIVQDAATELARTVAAAAGIFESQAPVAVLGRSAARATPLRAALSTRLASLDSVALVEPAGSPLDGACEFAAHGAARAYRDLIWRAS